VVDFDKLDTVVLTVEHILGYEKRKQAMLFDLITKSGLKDADGNPITEKDIILSGNPMELINDVKILSELGIKSKEFEIEELLNLYGIEYSSDIKLVDIKKVGDKFRKDNGLPAGVGATIGEAIIFLQ